MRNIKSKQSGYGGLIFIFFIAVLAIGYFVRFSNSLDEKSRIQELAFSAEGIQRVAIDDPAVNLPALANVTQASVVALLRKGETIAAARINGRVFGAAPDFDALSPIGSSEDGVFLGFVSATDPTAKAHTILQVDNTKRYKLLGIPGAYDQDITKKKPVATESSIQ